MQRDLVALFCIIVVVGINGARLKLSASIDEDAIELAQLTGKFWSLKPGILQRTIPVVFCQIIDECCKDGVRSEAISLLGQNPDGNAGYRFAEIIQTCMNSSAPHKANPVCSSFDKSFIPPIIAYDYPDVKQYFDIIENYEKQLYNLIDHISSNCNNEEIHALLCLSSKKLLEICAGKILRKIYDDDGYKAYQEFKMNTKKLLSNLNQQLS